MTDEKAVDDAIEAIINEDNLARDVSIQIPPQLQRTEMNFKVEDTLGIHGYEHNGELRMSTITVPGRLLNLDEVLLLVDKMVAEGRQQAENYRRGLDGAAMIPPDDSDLALEFAEDFLTTRLKALAK